MSFFQRIANYLANELIAERLARSKAFQQAAIKTHETIESSRSIAKVGGKKLHEQQQVAQKSGFKFLSELKQELINVNTKQSK